MRGLRERVQRKITTIAAAVSTFFVLSVMPAAAQFSTGFNDRIALSDRSPIEVTLYLISWFLGILFIIVLILIIYGGWLWMTSGGNEEKITRAKQVLRNALIGLLIILAAWGITLFLLRIFTDATGGSGGDGGPGRGCSTCVIPTGGSDFYVTATVPSAGETNVFLCYAVSVSMTRDIDRTTVDTDSFRLTVADGALGGSTCVTNDQCGSSVCSGGTCAGDFVSGEFAYVGDESRQIDFIPDTDFLSDETYLAVLSGGVNGVRSLTGLTTVTYDWTFSTGSETDEIPPQVESNSSSPFPPDGTTNVCTNTPINFDFSERMLPSSFNDDLAYVLDAAPADWTEPRELKNWTFGPGYDFAMVRPRSPLNAFTLYNVRLYGGDPDDDFAGSATDFCGNPIDGDADGVAEGDPIDNFFGNEISEAEDPVEWETGDNAECTPVVDGFTPTSDYYGEYLGLSDGEACSSNSECGSNSCIGGTCVGFSSTTLLITGQNLAPHPIVEMDGSLVLAEEGLNTCFDPAHLGNVLTNTTIGDICLYDDQGSLTEINLRTPVGAGDTNIVVEVAGDPSEPSAQELDVLSPYIATVNPPDGSIGQYITISGQNYGTLAPASRVLMRSEDGVRQSILELPAICGPTWTDSQIVAIIPETYVDSVTGLTETWASGDVAYVQVQNGTNLRYSDLQYFEFNDVVRPNLCPIVPNCSASAGAAFTAIGENFGGTQGSSEVPFAYAVETGWEASISSWSDGLIEGTTNTSMIQENYWSTVYNGNTDLSSNAVAYNIPCSSGPQVVVSNQCNALENLYPVPNPQPNEANACLNAGIAVLFDQEMNFSTFTNDTVFLQQYNSGSTFDPSYGPLSVSISSFAGYDAMGYFGFQTNIAQTQLDADQDGIPDGPVSPNLQSDTWYQMTITTGVQNTLGVSMGSPYVMQFKTDDTNDLCVATEINVTPASALLNSYLDINGIPRSQEYSGLPYAGCQLINPGSLSWAWAIDDTNIGNFGVGPGNFNTQYVYVSGDSLINVGSTDVTATADSLTDSANFTVDLGFCTTDADCSDSCTGSICSDNRCTPVIDSIDPSDGDHGTWTTISGCMFGPTRGDVSWNSIDGLIQAETEWPPEAQCSITWSANEIIAEVPEEYDSDDDEVRDTPLPETEYNIEVITMYDQNANSPQDFTLNTQERPGICQVYPDAAYEGASVTTAGTNLGTTQGYSSFLLDEDLLDPLNDFIPPAAEWDRVSATVVSAWSDLEIQSEVPVNAISGLSPFRQGYRAIIDGGDEQCLNDLFCSNPKNFQVSCDINSECGSGCCDPSGICLPASACNTCETDDDCVADGQCTGSTCQDNTCTPVINDVQNEEGPLGAAVTISGCYFGSQGINSAVTIEDLNAPILCGSSGWTNTQIIAQVPESGIPISTLADVEVTTQAEMTDEELDAYEVLATCTGVIPVPATGVPVLCPLQPTSGSSAFDGDPGDTITFTGLNFEADQDHVFSNERVGLNGAVAGPTSSTAEVAAESTSGDVYVEVLNCPSNPTEFQVSCDTVDECADGDFCILGVCTTDNTDCTPGNEAIECGPNTACVLDSGGDYICVNRPTLLSSYPENGDTDVCTNGLYTLEFSEQMVNYDEITITILETDPVTGITTEVDVIEGDAYNSVVNTTTGVQTLTFIPELDLLTASFITLDISAYEFILTIPSLTDGSAVDILNSAYGITLADGTVEISYTLAPSTCVPDSVDLRNGVDGNSNYTFSSAGQTVPYTATVWSTDGQPLAPTVDMGWEFSWLPYYNENFCANIAWVDITSAEDAATGPAATSETQTVVSGDEYGSVGFVAATATPTSGSNWTGSINAAGFLITYACEAGDLWQYVDDPANSDYATRAGDNGQYFSILYCKDDETPILNLPVVNVGIPSIDDWFLQYLFIDPTAEENTFGIRVYSNSENLSPLEWYNQNVPNQGSPSEVTVDGYQAVQDGLSFYISASNILTGIDTNGIPGEDLYNNIYLFTFNNEEALAGVAGQIMDSLRFNINVNHNQCEGSKKEKLVRDTKRVSDLGTLASLADTYRANNADAYPLPQSESFGSYLQEMTTSKWNSWQGALGNLFNQTLPVDPYNFFYAAAQDDPWEADATPWADPDLDNTWADPLSNAVLNDCEPDPDGNLYWDDSGSCWDPVNSLFFCPTNSHVYSYKREPGNPQDALFYANLEYESSVTETYLLNSATFNACAGISAGQNAVCDCFNYGLQSPATVGTPWTAF